MRWTPFMLALAVVSCGPSVQAPRDAGLGDAGSSPDAGVDAGAVDAGRPDAGSLDSGAPDAGTPDASVYAWPVGTDAFTARRRISIWEDPCPLEDGGRQSVSTWNAVLSSGELRFDACLCDGGTGMCRPGLHRGSVIMDAATIVELQARLDALVFAPDTCWADGALFVIETDAGTFRGIEACENAISTYGMYDVFQVLERVAKEH